MVEDGSEESGVEAEVELVAAEVVGEGPQIWSIEKIKWINLEI